MHLPKLDLPPTEEQRFADILAAALEERTALQTKSHGFRQEVAACKEQFSDAKEKRNVAIAIQDQRQQQRLKTVGRTGLIWRPGLILTVEKQHG